MGLWSCCTSPDVKNESDSKSSKGSGTTDKKVPRGSTEQSRVLAKEASRSEAAEATNGKNAELSNGHSSRKLKSRLQVNFEDLVFHETIGKGSFKTVFRGRMGNTAVAISRFRKGGMATEARIMQRLGTHPNLVSFYRWATDKHGHEYMVMELLAMGSLDKVLVQFGDLLRTRVRLSMCQQICSAVCELARERVLHRDLAARNVLVQSIYPKVLVKVSDFGLARPMGPNSEVDTLVKHLPVRWIPPEVITKQQWSEKSDVWSFGITMWEIFSNGAEPYADMDGLQVVKAVLSGTRLQRPPRCPKLLYQLMQECWADKPEERPTFAEIESRFKQWRLDDQQRRDSKSWTQLGDDDALLPSSSQRPSNANTMLTMTTASSGGSGIPSPRAGSLANLAASMGLPDALLTPPLSQAPSARRGSLDLAAAGAAGAAAPGYTPPAMSNLTSPAMAPAALDAMMALLGPGMPAGIGSSRQGGNGNAQSSAAANGHMPHTTRSNRQSYNQYSTGQSTPPARTTTGLSNKSDSATDLSFSEDPVIDPCNASFSTCSTLAGSIVLSDPAMQAPAAGGAGTGAAAAPVAAGGAASSAAAAGSAAAGSAAAGDRSPTPLLERGAEMRRSTDVPVYRRQSTDSTISYTADGYSYASNVPGDMPPPGMLVSGPSVTAVPPLEQAAASRGAAVGNGTLAELSIVPLFSGKPSLAPVPEPHVEEDDAQSHASENVQQGQQQRQRSQRLQQQQQQEQEKQQQQDVQQQAHAELALQQHLEQQQQQQQQQSQQGQQQQQQQQQIQEQQQQQQQQLQQQQIQLQQQQQQLQQQQLQQSQQQQGPPQASTSRRRHSAYALPAPPEHTTAAAGPSTSPHPPYMAIHDAIFVQQLAQQQQVQQVQLGLSASRASSGNQQLEQVIEQQLAQQQVGQDGLPWALMHSQQPLQQLGSAPPPGYVPLAYMQQLAEQKEQLLYDREAARLRRRQELSYLVGQQAAAPVAAVQRRRHSTTSSTWALQSHLLALEQLAAVQHEAMQPLQQSLGHASLSRRGSESVPPHLVGQHDMALLGLMVGQANGHTGGSASATASEPSSRGSSREAQLPQAPAPKVAAAAHTYIGIRMVQ